MLQDLRYGMRMLARNPGFTAVVVLSLGLGLGANTTIFTFVNALLLRPPAVEAPGALLEVWERNRNGAWRTLSLPSYRYYEDHNHAFLGILGAGFMPRPVSWTRAGQGELVYGQAVSGNYFSVLRVVPFLGRTFLPGEDQAAGKYPVVVLAHSFWQRRLAADPEVVGKSLTLNAHSFTVVGVAPPTFTGTQPFRPDFWAPFSMLQEIGYPADSRTSPGYAWVCAIGRLKPDVDASQALAELNVLAGQLEQSSPDTNKGWGTAVSAVSLAPAPVRGVVAGFSGMLMVVVFLVLLIACANAANLLLAKATRRRREIAIRSALGATRVRLIRQALTESILLSCLGGGVGLVSAFLTVPFALGMQPPIMLFPITVNLSLDWRVLSFTLLLSLLTGVVFGLAPAIRSSKSDLVGALKDDRHGGGHHGSYLRSALVVVQLAVCLMLLVGAALCLRSLVKAQSIDPGFEIKNRLVASLDLSNLGYSEEQGREFYRRLVERVEVLPGVISASLADYVPLGLVKSDVEVLIEGHEPSSGQQRVFISYRIVGPKYFQTMGTPLLSGRDFGPRDHQGATKVVIINEAMARRFWPDRDPVGQRVTILEGNNRSDLEIVGVVKTGKYLSLGEDPLPFMYRCFLQDYRPGATLVVHTAGNPRLLQAPVQREVQALDPNLALSQLQTLKEYMALSLFLARTTGVLLGAFGFLALVLAVVGVYGVTAYDVSQRTHEIGIRMALGARPGDVLGMVVRQGMVLTSIGLGIGLAGAFALTRFLSSLLYGVRPTDPTTFIGVSVLLTAVAALANYIPARRVTKVDPMVALRYE